MINSFVMRRIDLISGSVEESVVERKLFSMKKRVDRWMREVFGDLNELRDVIDWIKE